MIVVSVLLISDVIFNNYTLSITVLRVFVTMLGFLGLILFKLGKIDSRTMVLLYVVPTSCVASYMIAWQPVVSGMIQATSIIIIYGFVIQFLIIMTPLTWVVFSSVMVVSYLVMILTIGSFSIGEYLVNGGTVLICCFAGFPYVALIRHRLYRRNFKLQTEIEFYAHNDILTGCFNRRGGLRLLEQSIELSLRNNLKLSICFIDVDGLKEVNDRDGHAAGDALLMTVVDAVKARIRTSDELFRYGGDEFIIIFPGADEDECIEIVNQIKKDAEMFSYGIAEFSSEYSVEEFIRIADDRMYLDKKNG